MRRTRVWLFTAIFASALSASDTGEAPAIDLGALSPSEGWVRVNDQPYQISSSVNTLCVSALPPDLKPAPDPNPHAAAYVTVFVNRIGVDAMNATNPEFPEGSVIVKQKYHSQKPPERPRDAILYTVMIKRSAGYNPSVGDWEFAVLGGDGKSIESRGRLATCTECHKNRAETDFVYRSYREIAPTDAGVD